MWGPGAKAALLGQNSHHFFRIAIIDLNLSVAGFKVVRLNLVDIPKEKDTDSDLLETPLVNLGFKNTIE